MGKRYSWSRAVAWSSSATTSSLWPSALGASMERGSNRELIERLCRIARCRVGGGIRTRESALQYLRAGARSVILGTAASQDLLSTLPRERTIVAIDARGARVATHGWRSTEDESPEARAIRLAPYCGGFLFTDVEREGMMRGFDVERVRALAAAVGRPLTVAGGITTTDEVRSLDAIGVDAQVGMAVYTGVLDPIEAFVGSIDFEKTGGLVPTFVNDASGGRTRMLAYSNPQSLRLALREGKGVYWSRSRRRLWRKGESSGHAQRLKRVATDCDRDALVFEVEQEGPTCHTGAARCFGYANFASYDLIGRIDDRARSGDGGSYTKRLLNDAELLSAKVLEEAREVIEAVSPDEVAWECADLLYFMSVKMRSAGIGIEDVMSQLASRAT